MHVPVLAFALVIASGGGAGAALTRADTTSPPPESALLVDRVAPTAPALPPAAEDEPTAGAEELPPPAAATAPRGARSNVTAAAAFHEGEDVDLVPMAALAAYQRSDAVINKAMPGCHLDWAVIAAVGQVLTDHGRLDGEHVLDEEGAATPPIIGPAVRDARGHRLADSDAGELDGVRRHDRAVGPMLLAPAAWRDVGVDADGDGTRNPQDVDDAALATAVLLCAAGDDLRRPRHLTAALEGMNPDPEFASSVPEIAAAYEDDLAHSDPVPSVSFSAVLLARPLAAAAPPQPDDDPAGASDAGDDTGAEQPEKAAKEPDAGPGKPEPTKDPKGSGKDPKGTKDPAEPQGPGTDEGPGDTDEPAPEPETATGPEPDSTPEPEATQPPEDEPTASPEATCEESTEPEDVTEEECDDQAAESTETTETVTESTEPASNDS